LDESHPVRKLTLERGRGVFVFVGWPHRVNQLTFTDNPDPVTLRVVGATTLKA